MFVHSYVHSIFYIVAKQQETQQQKKQQQRRQHKQKGECNKNTVATETNDNNKYDKL